MSVSNPSRWVILGVFLLLLPSPFLKAKNKETTGNRPGASAGQTKSHKKVTLKLKRVDDGTEIIITQRVGERMTFDYNGLSYGITPTIDDLTQGIQLKIEKLERDKSDQIVSAQELENIIVDAKTAKFSGRSGLPFSMILQKVSESPVKQPTPGTSSAITPADDGSGIVLGGDTCCVTCDGLRSCACAVFASCGSCCSGDCC
ncbi:MAG: hypothetical protein ACREDR_24165 [Blastocatellia bacterium]